MSAQPNFTQLIPELQGWNDGKGGIDVESWICCVGRFDHAVGYAQLFWPEFTIHDDCVMFASFTVESYETWMQQASKHRGQVEAVIVILRVRTTHQVAGQNHPTLRCLSS